MRSEDRSRRWWVWIDGSWVVLWLAATLPWMLSAGIAECQRVLAAACAGVFGGSDMLLRDCTLICLTCTDVVYRLMHVRGRSERLDKWERLL